jgi:hypothetical protein
MDSVEQLKWRRKTALSSTQQINANALENTMHNKNGYIRWTRPVISEATDINPEEDVLIVPIKYILY